MLERFHGVTHIIAQDLGIIDDIVSEVILTRGDGGDLGRPNGGIRFHNLCVFVKDPLRNAF